MSKELYFTDGNNEVKYLDTTASFKLAITQDGSAFDLTNATAIDVKVANDTGYVFEKSIDMTTIKQPLAGLITMPVDAEVMNVLVPDDYTIEVWVTLSSLITPGSQEGLTDDGITTDTTTSTITDTTTYNAIFPSDDPQGFTITENVMSDSGDVIPVMDLDEFQQDFDQLKTDLTNKVSTLQGPRGLKGDTGNGISSTTIQYQISNNPTITPTGTWSNNIIASTQDNPYLWLQATLNYTDGTSKTFYLVSEKGDQGIQGVQGEKGDTGAGLQVKGKVNDVSQLPATGQDGYCYFVNTDMYIWTDGKWNNMGDISPDLSNYVTVTDLNNGLSTKVTDNKNGTEQLNGVRVQPFNKLSDTIGGRNLYLNSKEIADVYRITGGITVTVEPFDDTTNMWHIVAKQGIGSYLGIYLPNYANGKIPDNSDWSYSADMKGTGKITEFGIEPSSSRKPVVGTVGSGWSRVSQTGVVGNSEQKAIVMYFNSTSGPVDVYIKLPKLEIGSMPTDWTPAPEDKVNVTDMRKPASDVAGIEEVNAKQDKIGYTPADDSKVVHNTGNEEIAGTKTFDTAPIDKTTGNPYITKDGVPTVDLSSYAKTSDVTTAISTLKSETVSNVKGDTSIETIDGLKKYVHKPMDSEGYQFMTSEDVNDAISPLEQKINDTGWQPLVSKDSSSAAFSSDSYYRIVNGILYIHGTISVLNTTNLHYQLWDIPTGWSISDKAGTQVIYPDSTAYNNYVQLLSGSGTSYSGGLLIYEDKTGYSTDFRFVTPVDKA